MGGTDSAGGVQSGDPGSGADDMLARLEYLNEVGAALSREKDIDRLLESILVAAKNIAQADGGTSAGSPVDKPAAPASEDHSNKEGGAEQRDNNELECLKAPFASWLQVLAFSSITKDTGVIFTARAAAG